MIQIKKFAGIVIFCLLISSCKRKAATEEAPAEVRTPVTITSIMYDPMEESIDLNATSMFLQKSYVKSNLTGYVKAVNIKFGSAVNAGQTLFTLQTKESQAIGNTINKLNSGFKFSGVNNVKANANGYVTELSHQVGDYVQDGEQLAVLSDMNSFVFVMNVPYEDKQFVINNKQVELTLPDGTRMLGTIQTSMPFVDSLSQTQAVAIRVHAMQQIPQNLVAKVKIIKSSKASASALPKSAVLSDEAQSEFWVMKLIDDSTAVKTLVKKGIETGDRVEIISPAFNPKERFLLSGNYGLPDTAKISIIDPNAKPAKDSGDEKK
jgi:multidrug efflux pump subunit AcrA (membrane-fusion protein)